MSNLRFYEGIVRHRRHTPIERKFGFRLFMVHGDVDALERGELREVLGPLAGRIMHFERSDYEGVGPLADVIRDQVDGELGFTPGPITMLAHVRTWGACFNPIAVFYCHRSASDDTIDAVVLHVTNTPWKQRRSYVLDMRGEQAPWRRSFDKTLHVSPFLPMDLRHQYRGNAPGARLHVGIDDLDEADDVVFDTDLVLRSQTANAATGRRLLARYPFLTSRVSAGIHLHALALWARRVRIHPHPDKKDRHPMSTTIRPRETSEIRSLPTKLARKVGDVIFSHIDDGAVEIHDHETVTRYGEPDEPAIRVDIVDKRTWELLARRGGNGVGEAYINGWWTTEDLPGLLSIGVRNLGGLDRIRDRMHRLTGPITEPLRRLRRTPDPDNDRRNIGAHYDLSNDFFATFLDPTMTYSSAIFDKPEDTLEAAQRNKLDLLCRKLGLHDGHHVLEIGTGWGSFAIHAASTYGCAVTTTTISAQQYELARERVREAGLEHLVTVLDVDYRDLTGSYDRLVSIEMIEAVDWREHETYFEACERLLADDGLFAMQAILIDDARYERAKHSIDFIKEFVFPGGCLPSLTAIADTTRRATNLRIVDVEDYGRHYAETLRRWTNATEKARSELEGLGFDDRFFRLWEFYLGYCEAGFRERHVSVAQIVFANREWRGAPHVA